MKQTTLVLFAAFLIASAVARAAEAERIAISSITKPYDSDGSLNTTWDGSGGVSMSVLFDEKTSSGVYQLGTRLTGWFLIDFSNDSNSSSGYYYVTEIKVWEVSSYAYSISYTMDGSTWTAVSNATNVARSGSFGVNDYVKQIKIAVSTSSGWTQTLSEIEVWGIDPATMKCDHPGFTEVEYVLGSATCTARGKEKKKCTACGELFFYDSDVFPPLGHDYVSTLSVPGSSSGFGSGTISCSRGDFEETFNRPIDLTSLGGVKTYGVVQFTDLSVSSTGCPQDGVSAFHLIDGNNICGWDGSHCAYWFAETRSPDEYVQFDFGTEIDLTKIEFSAANHAHTLKFYSWDGETEEPIGEVAITSDGTGKNYQTGSIDFRGISVKGIRLHIIDSIGDSYYRNHPVALAEIHPYGTVKGSGKLDVRRSRIILY